jgi:hypothetical protein
MRTLKQRIRGNPGQLNNAHILPLFVLIPPIPTAAAPIAQNALDLSSPNVQIIRSPHKVNYSVVNNIGIDDPRLDPTALAIIIKRIRKPDT